MHHTTSAARFWLGRVLALILLSLGAGAALAQVPEGQTSVLIVPVHQTSTVEMSTKNPIVEVRNENPKIASVKPLLEDPRRVLVTGMSHGTTRVILIDNAKKAEAFEVRVPPDDEVTREENRKKLVALIRQAVPTAAVDVIASPNTVVLTGVIANVEQVMPITELARSIFGKETNVVNSMRIGGVHQVQVEVVVCRVNRGEARRFGFSFLETGSRHFVASTVAGPGSLAGSVGSSILQATANLASTPNAVFGIVGNKQAFVGFLDALRTEGIAKLTAHPYVTTMSGERGRVVSGGETPILTTDGQGAPNVSYKQFGTVVNFVPVVLGSGKIHLGIEAEVSQLSVAAGINIPSANGVTSVPGFDTRSAQVGVEMEDGQTLAIGGLIQNSITGATSKVPVLGDLPFIGAAFSTKTYSETEEELLILVTPRVVAPMGCDQLPRYWVGRHTRSPDDFELFLEGILEAPRGQRTPCGPGGIRDYTAAHKIGPTAGAYPCGDATQPCRQGNCAGGRCSPTSYGPNNCAYPSSGANHLTLQGNDAVLGQSLSTMPAPLPNLPMGSETNTPITPPSLPPITPATGELPGDAPPPLPPVGGRDN